MKFIQDNLERALASRLKSLSEQLMKDVKLYYEHKGVEFEPRWFPIVYLLNEKGPLAITEIGKELIQTHAAINQTVNIIERKGLVKSKKDGNDERKRLIYLSPKGKERVKQLQPLWEDIFKANIELLENHAPKLLEQLTSLEHALLNKPLYDRIIEQELRHQTNWNIKTLDKLDADVLNVLEQNVLTGKKFKINDLEQNELEMLVAKQKDNIIAVAVFYKLKDLTWELSSLAVNENFRSKGVATSLLDALLVKISSRGAEMLGTKVSPYCADVNNFLVRRGFYYVDSKKKNKNGKQLLHLELRIGDNN